jgi:magnesium transporter
MEMTVLTYSPTFAEIKNLSSADELSLCKKKEIMWVNINGLKDVDLIKNTGKIYGIHPLTIEDVLNTKQQPKVETFEKYRYISFKSIQREKTFSHTKDKQQRYSWFYGRKNQNDDEEIEEFRFDQISMIIMGNIVITFQEIPGDPFNGIRKRILEDLGQVRKKGADYLAYALLDAVVDDYYITLAHIEEDIENYEDRAVKTTDDTFISEIQDTKKYLFQIKRSMLPLRDNLTVIARQKILMADEELKPFMQDLQENLNNAIDTVENYRDWLSYIMEVNLSMLSYQMNKVMKILAIVSAVFIPLTFIAGVYGMNFEKMPELGQPWGYPIVLGAMVIIALVMLLFFKKRHWF